MGLTNDERSSLVELRLEKAKRFIAEAEQMLSMGLWDLAANRFYYSCFHAAQALLIHYGLSAHTHAGTLGVFGMNFVKTGKIDKELGAFFSRMEQLRMKADYNCEYDVSNSDVENMLQPAHDFLNSIIKLITTNPKVTTAQIAVVYPRTISPEPQKNDFWVKVILHIIVFP